MRYSLKGVVTCGLVIAASVALPVVLRAQAKSTTPPPVPRVEPGLEVAVTWKWKVVPPETQEWGLPSPVPEAPPAPAAGAEGLPTTTAPGSTEPRPTEYEVKSGDKLILIGKKFGLTAQQIKTFNGLTTDTIRIGQVLKIPTMEDLRNMPPPPVVEEKPKPKEKQEKAEEPPAQVVIEPQGQEDLMLQVFLDREGFSTGPIDGNPGTMFAAVSQLYRESRDDVPDMVAFRAKARSAVGDPLTNYTLRAEDHRFISPAAEGANVGTKGKSRAAKASAEPPPPTYDELVAAPFLAYRTAWEFVAEKFHCSEAFLRKLNPRIKGIPEAGAVFQVPNVVPFEIEKAFDGALQPAADPQSVVTAAIVGLSRLEISQNGKLVAVMPLALARPDLRGRGSWTILDAIARPRLATSKESKDQPAPPPVPAPATPAADPAAAKSAPPVAAAVPPPPAPSPEQYLAEGPNNPVGIVWINLAKAKSTEPLPYGLHGTSIPGRMQIQEGLGGLRLANWDIIRALRLLPKGAALQWR